jgi:hypothetical protein
MPYCHYVPSNCVNSFSGDDACLENAIAYAIFSYVSPIESILHFIL